MARKTHPHADEQLQRRSQYVEVCNEPSHKLLVRGCDAALYPFTDHVSVHIPLHDETVSCG